jgi:hypothetical protein
LETFSDNLSLIQEEDTDEEGNIVPKQIFSLSGDLIVERLKAQKIEAEEIEVAGITISQGRDSDENIDSDAVDNSGMSKNDSLGKITIPQGIKEIVVANKIVKNNSYIMLTPNRPVPVGVSEIREGKYFKISLEKALDEDLEVNWFILKKNVP